MACQQIILALLIIVIILYLTRVDEYFSYENSETTPMPQYLPKFFTKYIADNEPECGNHFGFYDVTEPKQIGKRIINAKFATPDATFNAYCSPYVLNSKAVVCAVYDVNGEQLFYGFSNPRC